MIVDPFVHEFLAGAFALSRLRGRAGAEKGGGSGAGAAEAAGKGEQRGEGEGGAEEQRQGRGEGKGGPYLRSFASIQFSTLSYIVHILLSFHFIRRFRFANLACCERSASLEQCYS